MRRFLIVVCFLFLTTNLQAQQCSTLTTLQGGWDISYYLPGSLGIGTNLDTSVDDFDGNPATSDFLIEQTLYDSILEDTKSLRLFGNSYSLSPEGVPTVLTHHQNSQDFETRHGARLSLTSLGIPNDGGRYGVTVNRTFVAFGWNLLFPFISLPFNTNDTGRSIRSFQGTTGVQDPNLSLIEPSFDFHPNQDNFPFFDTNPWAYFRNWTQICDILPKQFYSGRHAYAFDIDPSANDGKEILMSHFFEMYRDLPWCFWKGNPIQIPEISIYKQRNGTLEQVETWNLPETQIEHLQPELPQWMIDLLPPELLDYHIPQNSLLITDFGWNIAGAPAHGTSGPILAIAAPTMSFDRGFLQPNNYRFGGVFIYGADGYQRSFHSSFLRETRFGSSLVYVGLMRDRQAQETEPQDLRIFAAGGPEPYQSVLEIFGPGSNAMRAGHIVMFDENGNSRIQVYGDNADDHFGASLAALGDINCDNVPDLLVGAPGGNYARVVSGENGRTLYNFTGPSGSKFGYKVGSFDRDADGKSDVAVVTAPGQIDPFQAIGGVVHFFDIKTCVCGVQGTPGNGPVDESAIERLIEIIREVEEQIRTFINDPNYSIPFPLGAITQGVNLSPLDQIEQKLIEAKGIVTSSLGNARMLQKIDSLLLQIDKVQNFHQTRLDAQSALKPLQKKIKKLKKSKKKSAKKKLKKLKNESKKLSTSKNTAAAGEKSEIQLMLINTQQLQAQAQIALRTAP